MKRNPQGHEIRLPDRGPDIYHEHPDCEHLDSQFHPECTQLTTSRLTPKMKLYERARAKT